jgi:hypothetical protein
VKIAIIGAGALGAVYGVRLTLIAKQDVTFVVRAARAKQAAALHLQKIDNDEKLTLDSPSYVTSVPENADVIIVTVRQDQIDSNLISLLATTHAPVVVLTPMFPEDMKRLEVGLGSRVFPTMPSVVSYEKNGAIRYWLPKSATTAIESERAPAALLDLKKNLEAAGITSQMKKGVLAENVATMVSFMPIAFALDSAGGIDALLGDKDLLHLGIDGVKEAGELAKKIGQPSSWANLLLKFVGGFTLKAGIAVAKRTSPEAVFYVEEHFGRKLHDQNLSMAQWMMKLAEEHETRSDSLHALYTRLSQVK